MGDIVVKRKGNHGFFLTYVQRRIAENRNFLCAITGPTGSGKSYSALWAAEQLDADFDIRNVCFEPKEFLDLLTGKTKQLRRGSVLLFDEIQVSMGALAYQSIQSRLINSVLQTFRSMNLIVFFTTPSFGFVDASARKLFHSRWETVSIDRGSKTVKIKPYLLQLSQLNGKVYQKWLRIYRKEDGMIPLTQLSCGLPSPKLLADYEEKKKVFIGRLNERVYSELAALDGASMRELTQKQRDILQDLLDGLTVPDIAERRGIHRRSVFTHFVQLKRKGIRIIARKKRDNHVYRYDISGHERFFSGESDAA